MYKKVFAATSNIFCSERIKVSYTSIDSLSSIVAV